MIAWLRYTTLRMALFLIPFVVLLLLGVEPVFAAIAAILISAALSLFLLKNQRNALAVTVAQRQQKWSKKINDATTKEDLD